jgi:hypothetical protein
MKAVTTPFCWYREPMVWLGVVIFFGSLYGCFELIRTAGMHIDAPLPEPVSNTGKMQISTQRLSAVLPTHARLERVSDSLRLQTDQRAGMPPTLTLLFWNTRAELDVSLQLQRQNDGSYHAAWPVLPSAAMHVRVDTPARDDALIGDWPQGASATELHEPAR